MNLTPRSYSTHTMGRKHALPIRQPDDLTCGPTALKVALRILGKRKSLGELIELCKTNRNGTNTGSMVNAINKLGLSALVVTNASLHHLQSALKYHPNQMRAVLVTYLYDLDEELNPHPESGHWAVVRSFRASDSHIVLLDSASGQKKSYHWSDFRLRWKDFDLKRRKSGKNKFRLVKNWQRQLLVVVSKTPDHLPKFRINTSKLFTPARLTA